MIVSEDEFFYELHNGDKPPYCDIHSYILSIGSLFYFDNREYKVIEYDIINHVYTDNDMMLLCIKCEFTGNIVLLESIVRDVKIDKIL